MLLSSGNVKFQTFISERNDNQEAKPSALISVSSSFVHFMLLQLLSLFIAIVFQSLDFYVPWPVSIRTIVTIFNAIFSAIGYLIFLYSIATMVAAVLAVFRMTSWFEIFQNHNKDSKQ